MGTAPWREPAGDCSTGIPTRSATGEGAHAEDDRAGESCGEDKNVCGLSECVGCGNPGGGEFDDSRRARTGLA